MRKSLVINEFPENPLNSNVRAGSIPASSTKSANSFWVGAFFLSKNNWIYKY